MRKYKDLYLPTVREEDVKAVLDTYDEGNLNPFFVEWCKVSNCTRARCEMTVPCLQCALSTSPSPGHIKATELREDMQKEGVGIFKYITNSS